MRELCNPTSGELHSHKNPPDIICSKKTYFQVIFKIPSQFWFTCYNPIEKSVNTSKTTGEEIVASRKTPQKNHIVLAILNFLLAKSLNLARKKKATMLPTYFSSCLS
jgi:hypothetical protein